MSKINLSLKFIAVLLTASVLYSCGKKEQPAGTTNNTEKTTTQTSTGTNSTAKSDDDKVDINNFKAKYKFEGTLQGDAELVKKGDKARQLSNIKINDMESSQQTFIDYTGTGTVHMVMNVAGQKVGMKFDMNDFREFAGKDKSANAVDYIKDMDKYLQKGKKTGEETILGKTCEVYDMQNGMVMSVYDRKIPMRIKVDNFSMVMTDFDNDANISDSDLVPPSDIQYGDGSDLGGMVKKLQKK